MTVEEFATHIEAVLAEVDDGGLSIEEQITVPERITQAMRKAPT